MTPVAIGFLELDSIHGRQRFLKLRSDSNGRVMVRLDDGEDIQVVAARDGYLPAALNLKCSRDLMVQEQIVTLQKPR
jgi:hypothetical protein